MTHTDPLRIAFCHFTADVYGGSDFCLYHLVTHLPHDRFVPLVILKTGDPMAARYAAQNIPVVELHFVPPRRALEFGKLARYFSSFVPSVIRTARAIRRHRADVVHVNTLQNLQGAFAARLARRPLVWHIREIGTDSKLARIMLSLVARMADRVVPMSKAIAATLQGCDPRLRLIYDGIDLSRFDAPPEPGPVRSELSLEADAPIVTVVGRIEPWKGQHIFLEAVPAVLEAHPRARALIVGGPAINKPWYCEQLQARCRELGIADRVLFTGIRTDIPRILAASNVLVLPSATPEPFGLTVVEGMAAGCPVVATAAGGPLESVVDGVTGWLVPPNDAAAMVNRINHLLDDPEQARAMGEQGRLRARSCFSAERYGREMADVFEEVVRG